MKPSSNRAILCGLAAVSVTVPAASCRPSADIQQHDLRTYTVPRAANQPAPAGPVGPRGTGASDTTSPMAVAGPELSYELPDGWTDEGPAGMRLATLKTGPAGAADTGEITIIPASGTLAGNATRWQEQLTPGGGQERVARALKEAEKVQVNGVEGTVLLLRDDATENGQAILAAMIPLDGSTSLFVKFKGSAELASGLRGAFTTFVRSIRWK